MRKTKNYALSAAIVKFHNNAGSKLQPFFIFSAVQLLTHLYNQTHPTIQSCTIEDLPSPSKKLKTNHSLPKTSPVNNKSPEKVPVPTSQIYRSPRKLKDGVNDEGMDKENYVYEVTNETPEIRDIESVDEDWVFQKRSKTKVRYRF